MPLSRANGSSRAQIGLLAPAAHLYEDLTLRENLEFFTSLYGRKNDASQHQFGARIGGSQRPSRRLASTLSSGMKCRLSIAKWDLLKPGLLLLDEPYGVLDGSGVDLLEEFSQGSLPEGQSCDSGLASCFARAEDL